MGKNILIIILFLYFIGCTKEENKSDAYGNFEAIETIVSAESTGKLIDFNVEEGMEIKEGEIIGKIETEQLLLKKRQIEAQKKLINTKFKNVASQIAVIEQQKNNALIEKERIENLFKDGVATQKQVDDINGNIKVLEKQISTLETQYQSIKEELNTLNIQIEQIHEQFGKCEIINPLKGTVLLKLVEENEVVTYGKPLYKIANLEELNLKVYISGDMLSEVVIGQTVKVLIDIQDGKYKEMEGVINWISSKAEFTPKIVQTKEERVKLVYAMKVKVKNDGSLKIGMPGEVVLKR